MLLKTEYWTDEEHEPINPHLWAEISPLPTRVIRQYDVVFFLQVGERIPILRVKCRHSQMDKRIIAILRLDIITLQHDKVKDCDWHPPQYVQVQIDKPGKVCLDVKGA